MLYIITNRIIKDFAQIKTFLNGKLIENIKRKTKEVMEDITKNRVPMVWKCQFIDLNLDFSSFSGFIKS